MTGTHAPSNDQPLDLSVKKCQPPKAHCNMPDPNTCKDFVPQYEDHVLNLSSKTPKLEAISPKPTTPASSLDLSMPSSKAKDQGHHNRSTSSPLSSSCNSRESTPKSSSLLNNDASVHHQRQHPRLPSKSSISIPTHHHQLLHIPDPSLRPFPSQSASLAELEGSKRQQKQQQHDQQLEHEQQPLDLNRFQHSDIFKYMTQKGLFRSGYPAALLDLHAQRKLPASVLNTAVLAAAQITGVIPPNNHHPHRDSPTKLGGGGVGSGARERDQEMPPSPLKNSKCLAC